jgi:hypothetical protein
MIVMKVAIIAIVSDVTAVAIPYILMNDLTWLRLMF